MCDHFFQLSKMFYGATITEVRGIAYEFAERNNMKHNFNHEIKLAGKCRAQSFIRWNRELSVRKPEPTTVSRILAFNRRHSVLWKLGGGI
jgi:hypothetical protein